MCQASCFSYTKACLSSSSFSHGLPSLFFSLHLLFLLVHFLRTKFIIKNGGRSRGFALIDTGSQLAFNMSPPSPLPLSATVPSLVFCPACTRNIELLLLLRCTIHTQFIEAKSNCNLQQIPLSLVSFLITFSSS